MDYEEISLKELIILLIKGWKWIVSTTIITTVLALIFTLGFKPVVYESNSHFNINIPTSVQTPFGVYTLPSTKVADYTVYLATDEVLRDVIESLDLEISVESLKNSVHFTYDNSQGANLVQTTVSFDDPQLAAQIHKSWLEHYQLFVEKTYKLSALETLKSQNINDYNSLIIEQTNLIDELSALQSYKETLSYTKGVSELESADNHLYYLVLNRESALAIRNYQIDILKNRKQSDLEALNNMDAQTSDLVILEPAIILPLSIEVPSSPLDSGLLLNASIGLVLGAMVAVFIVFFINYWKSETK